MRDLRRELVDKWEEEDEGILVKEKKDNGVFVHKDVDIKEVWQWVFEYLMIKLDGKSKVMGIRVIINVKRAISTR